MRTLFTIFLLFTFTIGAMAQIEGKDSIPLIQRHELYPSKLKPNTQGVSLPKPANYQDKRAALDNAIDKAVGTGSSPQATSLKLPPLNVYLGPPIRLKDTKYPFANDYAYSSFKPLGNNLYLGMTSTSNFMPSLARANSVSSNLYYQPTDKLTVWGGVIGSKYEMLGRFYGRNVGVGGGLRYQVSDRVWINGYGQYSGKSNNAIQSHVIMNTAGQRYYGGTVEVKITDKFGIQGGMERQLDPFSGKWKNVPVISPVFYSK